MTVHGELSRPTSTDPEEFDFSTLRSSVPRIAEPGRKRFRISTAGVAAIALLLGCGLGGFIVRQRYRSKEVVVAINGSVIKQSLLYHVLERTYGAAVMRSLVQDELSLQFATGHKAMPLDSDVEKRLAEEERNPDFTHQLNLSGQTEDDVRRKLRVQLAQANVIRRGVTVSNDDIYSFYLANIDKKNPKALFYTPESVTVEIVVTPTEEDANKAAHELNDGVPFATVANDFSRDTSRFNGGMLPPILRGRTSTTQITGLDAVLFNMLVDQRIGPTKIGGIWWIVHCVDRKPETLKSFAQVKSQCRELAILTKGFQLNAKRVNSEFAEFRKTAKIQVFWEQYKGVIKQ